MQPRLTPAVPSIISASPFWAALGAFCLLGGVILFLLAESQVFDAVKRLVKSAQSGPSPLVLAAADAIREGIEVWAKTGVLIGAVTLPLALPVVRDLIGRGVASLESLFFRVAPLPTYRSDGTFFFMAAATLGLTLLAYWSLTAYEHVDWLEGEDGLSEWWSVVTFFVGSAAAGATAWTVRSAEHRGIVGCPTSALLRHWVSSYSPWRRSAGAS